MSKILIAYYSRKDENYVSGEIKDLKVGNTEIVAKFIQEITNGDLFEIEQATPYSKNYNECIEEARLDQKNNARPVLKNYLPNIDAYDEIYLGYPNYWNTMPMAVFTFLEKYDFSGKTIKPFCTNEGSGLGSSISDIKKLCPSAIIKKGLALHGATVTSSKKSVKEWIQNNK